MLVSSENQQDPAEERPLAAPSSKGQPKGKSNYPFLGDYFFGDNPDEKGNVGSRKYREALRRLSPEERKQVIERRKEAKRILGIKNFKELEGRYGDEAFTEKLDNSVADHLAQLKFPEVGDRELARRLAKREMPRLAEKVNEFIKYVLKEFFQNGELDQLHMTNEPKGEYTPAELVLASNDRRAFEDLIARFDPLRKAELMLMVAEVECFKLDHADDLKFLNQILAKYIYSPDRSLGHHGTHYLVSEQVTDGKSDYRRCVAWRLYGDKESAQRDMERAERPNRGSGAIKSHVIEEVDESRVEKAMTSLELRSFDTGGNGSRKSHPLRCDIRQKSDFSVMLKLIRKNQRLPRDPRAAQRLISDLNGARFTEEDKEDVTFLVRKIQNEVGAHHKIEHLEPVGHSMGQDGALKCEKHTLSIHDDSKNVDRIYEFQFLTFAESEDYHHRQPHSHELYEISRFFKLSPSKSLFPRGVYKDLDHEQYMKMAQEQVESRRKRINSHMRNGRKHERS